MTLQNAVGGLTVGMSASFRCGGACKACQPSTNLLVAGPGGADFACGSSGCNYISFPLLLILNYGQPNATQYELPLPPIPEIGDGQTKTYYLYGSQCNVTLGPFAWNPYVGKPAPPYAVTVALSSTTDPGSASGIPAATYRM